MRENNGIICVVALCFFVSLTACLSGCGHLPDGARSYPLYTKGVLVLKADAPAVSELNPFANALCLCTYSISTAGVASDVNVFHWSVVHGVLVDDYASRQVGREYALVLVDARGLSWINNYPQCVSPKFETPLPDENLLYDAAFRPNLSIGKPFISPPSQ
jgi:hypothetical protein